MRRYLLTGVGLMLGLFATLHAWAADPPHVLFVSSYNPSFHSFAAQIDGLKGELSHLFEEGEGVALDIEYIDGKEFQGPENILSFRTRLALKMTSRERPKVVVAGDDIAFKFAKSEKNALFADIPVVFLGVNQEEAALAMNADPQFTGVIEKPSFGENLTLAHAILDQGTKIYVIADGTRTGRINFNTFMSTAEYKSLQDSIKILSLSDLSYDELAAKLREVEPGAIIYLMSAYQDATGATKTQREIRKLLDGNTTAPYLHPWESHLGEGTLGGIVISHYEQGKRAGQLVSSILGGSTPAELPVIASSPNKLVIDHAVMEAAGLRATDIPGEPEFINVAPSFLGGYREYAVAAGIFLVLQSGIIFLLIIANRRRKSAEQSLRENQQRFRDFAKASSDWFWEMDSDLRFSYFSDRFEEITGVPPSNLLGKTREETGIPGVEVDEWERHLAALRHYQPFREFIHPREKDGETVWLAISGEPVFDTNGLFQGYRGTGADITKRRAADEAVREALRSTEQANQSKTNFLAMMSHEFRTPLNAILGFSDILRREILGKIGNQTYKEYAADIHESGKHMLALVNDVLDISAVEAGKRALEKVEIEVADLLEACAHSLRQTATDRDISIELDVEAGVPALKTDRRAAKQILFNLLSNAMKYNVKGGQVVLAGFVREDAIHIQVSDTGVGISASKLPGITEPFTRSHTDPMIAQEEGAGLGLAIVASLVEELGAELSFESSVGEGTVATIRFPLKQEK